CTHTVFPSFPTRRSSDLHRRGHRRDPEGTDGMNDKVYGVGVVGWGFMGKTHTFGYHTIPFFYSEPPINFALKGVCVRRPETLDRSEEHTSELQSRENIVC